ncbi:MAG TPA: hypothetical protein VHO95_04705, partial [Candidatus Dormibacteraeota bacterium]|nr:hypothetical protein [Candidatus Dormibacteraeota bacterium]
VSMDGLREHHVSRDQATSGGAMVGRPTRASAERRRGGVARASWIQRRLLPHLRPSRTRV